MTLIVNHIYPSDTVEQWLKGKQPELRQQEVEFALLRLSDKRQACNKEKLTQKPLCRMGTLNYNMLVPILAVTVIVTEHRLGVWKQYNNLKHNSVTKA